MDAKNKVYDVLIVGGGPAGLTAALYCARSNFSVLVIEQMLSGGQIATTDRIDNYPGFPEGIGGVELGQRLEEQGRRFGAEFILDTVVSVSPGEINKVGTAGSEYLGRSLIIATGTDARSLGIPGEKELRGRGVSYCATCDGAFFKEKIVGVVGGGDSAVEEALYLTRFATRVHLIHRRDRFRAAQKLAERAMAETKINIHWETVVREIGGDRKVEFLQLENVNTGRQETLPVDGVFIYAGRSPNTRIVERIAELDREGYIITDENMATSVPGVFAAGDVRRKGFRQVITAAADGAIAAVSAARFIEQQKYA